MIDFSKLLESLETAMRAGYAPPPHLLRKMNADIPLDREMLRYTLEGGPAGGYFHWLALLTRILQPRTILELGNRYGNSTILIYAELAAASQLISVDLERDQRYIPEEVWNDPRVKMRFGDCLDLSIYGDDLPLDVDVLWTDTVHIYDQVKAEFVVYEPLLADDALVVVDDINLNDKRKFFDEAPFAKFDLTTSCHTTGFGVIHYVRPPSERGKSRETRQLTATLRANQIFAQRYWAQVGHISELEEIRARSLVLPRSVKRALGATARALGVTRITSSRQF